MRKWKSGCVTTGKGRDSSIITFFSLPLLSFSPRAEKLPCGNLSLPLNSKLFKKTFSFTASMGHSTASVHKKMLMKEGKKGKDRKKENLDVACLVSGISLDSLSLAHDEVVSWGERKRECLEYRL